MEKEQVIEKLEKVFGVACDQFINARGNVSDMRLTEIRELGDTIIRVKNNVRYEVERSKKLIESTVDIYLKNQEKKVENNVRTHSRS